MYSKEKTLLLILKICIVITAGEIQGQEASNFAVERLDNSSGLYQECLGTVHVSTNSWRFDVIMNLTTFKVDSEMLLKSIVYTKQQCENEGKLLGCEPVARELMQREQLLQLKLKELFLIYNPSQRHRRDLLDKVGNVANVLFGLMDSDDAQKIYKAIDELSADNSAIFQQISEHRTTINTVIRAFNQTKEELNTNFRSIKVVLSEMGQQVNENKKELLISEIQTVLFLHAFKIEQKISELTDIIQKAHDGIISGKLFRLPEFSEALAKLHFVSSQGIKLPFNIDKLHLRQLNAIGEIEGHYWNNMVVLSITIPITTNVLDLYKSTSIPISVGPDTFAIIDNSYTYIASDQEHKEVMLLTKEQLSKCSRVDKITFVCSHSIATYTDKSKNCIRRLITGHNDHSICQIKGFRTDGEFWECLASDNQWLFVLPKISYLHIACPNEKVVKELSGIGILHLKPLCKAYTNEIQLLTVSRAVEYSSFTVHLDNNILNNYNFTSLPAIEFEKNGLGHIHLQDVGSNVPLIPLANSTYQKKRTLEELSSQYSQIRLYERLLLGIGIGVLGLITICVLLKFRLEIVKLLFFRNKTTQTDESFGMLEQGPRTKEPTAPPREIENTKTQNIDN